MTNPTLSCYSYSVSGIDIVRPLRGRPDGGGDGCYKYLTPLGSNKTGLNICRTIFTTLSGRPRRGRTISIKSATVRFIKHDKVGLMTNDY